MGGLDTGATTAGALWTHHPLKTRQCGHKTGDFRLAGWVVCAVILKLWSLLKQHQRTSNDEESLK